MELSNKKNKDKVAIVVVGYNRKEALKRLLYSLSIASYPNNEIPIYISIDASHDVELYEYVDSFEWPHGDKYLNIQNERLGLKNHILKCGDLTRFFRAIILLEDDVFVSENFYDYVLCAINYYYDEDRVGGISLVKSEMGHPSLPTIYMEDGSDSFLKQMPASWGECWTDKQWNGFRCWLTSFRDEMFEESDIPERAKQWRQAWSKYYMAYLVATHRYFVYPYVSLTTCFGDAGEHAKSMSTISQTNLLVGTKEKYFFRPFDKMTKYDVYGVNESIYKWIGIPKEDLFVDWYGQYNNTRGCKYLLTTIKLPINPVRTFALVMRPIELNVKYNIPGDEIFLYDTKSEVVNYHKNSLPTSLAYYYLQSFNFRLLVNYVTEGCASILKKKIKK